MSHIVDHLRWASSSMRACGTCNPDEAELDAAADEIEHLRRALEKIAAQAETRTGIYAAHLARVALETSRVREEG
jgi:methylphosphotriester-DNA--protein-cysteine methyltransferase